jgi:hypothetical protein
MEIIYTPNPLETNIILNEQEKKEFWYKLKIDELQELLLDCHFSLEKENIDDAKKFSDYDYYISDDDNKSNIDIRCDELLEYYLKELQSSHAGDCTCLPCACCKCIAENHIGFYSTKGLDSHSAYKIFQAFKSEDNNKVSIDQALNKLKNPSFEKTEKWNHISQEQFDKYVTGWKIDYKKAYDYLLEHKIKNSF